MVKETDSVQSLKTENDKFKEKVDALFGELKQLKKSLKQQHPGSHDTSNCDEAGATKSLDFLSKEYDDLVKFRKQAEARISAMEKVFDHHNNSYISLECKNYLKYLVALIDEVKSFLEIPYRPHLIKISKTIDIIVFLTHFVPLNTLHHIYISLDIQPYLLYGLIAWRPSC